eukprot:5033361-Amphidinium_carterae.1
MGPSPLARFQTERPQETRLSTLPLSTKARAATILQAQQDGGWKGWRLLIRRYDRRRQAEGCGKAEPDKFPARCNLCRLCSLRTREQEHIRSAKGDIIITCCGEGPVVMCIW